MFGHKLKFACLALTGCVFQVPFLGCSREAALTFWREFVPATGQAWGTALGTSLGTGLDINTLLTSLQGLAGT